MSMGNDRIEIREWMDLTPDQIGELFAVERRNDPEIDRFTTMAMELLTGGSSEERLRGLRVEFETLRPIARLAVWSTVTSCLQSTDFVMTAHQYLADGVLSCFKGIEEYEKSV